jgi:class 3 adenylate cyclase/tetratricopeptide (TPR) repeat protein
MTPDSPAAEPPGPPGTGGGSGGSDGVDGGEAAGVGLIGNRGAARAEDLLPYLAAPAIEWARSDDPKDGAARWQAVEGTMVFGDVSGFTNMSERLARHGKVGAEEVAEGINTCFEQLLDVAYGHGGTLIKFGGDALLLLFTGPDHAARAAYAAIGMRARLRDAGRLQTTAGQVRLRISIGVHSGTFDLFLVGGSHRELVVAGPAATATVAAEGTATAGEIVMSNETAALLPPRARGPSRSGGFLLRAPSDARPQTSVALPESAGADLSRYVPTAIRRHLLEGGREPEHRTATVAFLHFDETDSMVAEVGGPGLAERLDVVVRAAQRAADEHGVTFLGTDIDHDGGKIILTAGVPRRVGDDEQRMLLALRQVVDEPLPLRLRVGVNTGPVFAGDIGTPFRRTFTVMGDTVNLAARLMARAHPDQVLSTASVLDRSSVGFEVIPLLPFTVKGKKQPVRAFAVGAVERRHRARRDHLPLVGREVELAAMGDDLDAVRGGGGRVLELVGDHGTGKSRLAERFLRAAGGMESTTVVCERYESTTPYATFWMLGRWLLGLGVNDPPEAVGRRLREYVDRHVPTLAPLVSLLGTVLDLDIPDPPALSAFEPEFRRRAVADTAARFFLAALSRPLALVVEDAHFMDPASQEIMALIAHGLAEHPGAVCVTRRETGEGFVTEDGPHARRLSLGPLTTSQAAEALIAAADENPLLPYEIRLLADRSGGNPLFLEELWRAHREGASADALPDSVEAAVGAQIDRLAPQDRQLLRCAAVLGSTFVERDLHEVLALEGQPTATAPAPGPTVLTSALGEFLAVDDSGVVRFRSALVRDCAYEGLPYRRRRELHGRAAETLESRVGEEAEAALLSLHYFHAQRYPEAWRHALVAAQRAGELYANIEAATLYQRALACVPRLADLDPVDVASTWELMGDVRERAGDFGGATSAYRRARRLIPTDVVAQAELCLKEAWMAERRGRNSEAIRWIGRGLRTIDGASGSSVGCMRAQLMTWYAVVRQAQGRSADAVEWCERAVAEARTSGDRDAEAHALSILDWAWVTLDRPERAVHSHRALAIYRERGDLGGEAHVLNNLGGFAYFRGQWDDAISLYGQGRDIRMATGNDVVAAIGTFNIGEILADQGHDDEARAQLRESLQVLRAAGYPWAIAYATMLLGRLEARMGAFEDAHRHLEAARREFLEADTEADAVEAQSMMAECLVLEGRAADALELADRLLAEVVAHGSGRGTALIERVRGYALAQRGDVVGAGAAFEVSRASAEALDADYELALTLNGLRAVAVSSGDEEAAHDLAVKIDALTEKLGIVRLPIVPMEASVAGGSVSAVVGAPA